MDRDTITWLGQSTFLIRMGGKVILTDPFLTANAFPVAGIGPRRFAPPGIAISNLPPVDMLIISHDHHDHLDPKTLKALPGKEKIEVFVPLGLMTFFAEIGYTKIREFDWFHSASVGDIAVTALPAVHNSGRGLNNKNKNLWCSWSLRAGTINLYFAGDTAYSPTAFTEIGDKHGPFDAALLPIGAYEPREFMIAYHVNPEEAVQMGIDLKARNMAAMHWGTLDLSDEPYGEPPERFKAKALKEGISEERIWILKIGETRAIQHRGPQ